MIRALICDIYGTLLEMGPPPPQADTRWASLWAECVGPTPAPSLQTFEAAVRPLIARHHIQERARGLVQPEVDWPALAAQAFPALQNLTPANHDHFFFTHAKLTRTTRLAQNAATCLQHARRAGVLLGLASNAQACTRLELNAALATARLTIDLFTPDLCFFSFEHGIAKPDPHVFHWLNSRLAARGIAPETAVMVGDRPDNDVAPAKAAGWQTWLLGPTPCRESGDWTALHHWLLRA